MLNIFYRKKRRDFWGVELRICDTDSNGGGGWQLSLLLLGIILKIIRVFLERETYSISFCI